MSDAIATITCTAISIILGAFLWIELSGALKPPIA
jgi:hypothetical protein